MKKKFVVNALFGLFIAVFLIGCTNNTQCNTYSSTYPPVQGKSKIAKNILEMRNNGLFDSFLIKVENRSVSDDLSEDDLLLLRFINETDDVLEEIAQQENGDKELKLIDCLFTESSSDDVINAFYDLSDVMGNEYKQKMELLQNNLAESYTDRSIGSNNNIQLCYFNPKDYNSRKAYAADFKQSTRNWYTGFCAAAVAGCVAASYGGFWTRIAGIAAATAGLGSMAVQLGIWCNCSDLGKLISALKNQDAYVCNKILHSDLGMAYGDIILETSITLTACYITPAGRALVHLVIGKINEFIAIILDVLPAGINYSIAGVPIKPIVF